MTNPYGYSDDTASAVESKNRPHVATVTSIVTNRRSNNPPHSVKAHSQYVGNIEVEIVGVGGGDYYLPSVGSRIIVEKLINGEWISRGAESNPTADDYEADERVIGPATYDSSLTFDAEGRVVLTDDDGSKLALENKHISYDADDATIVMDADEYDIIGEYEDEYK